MRYQELLNELVWEDRFAAGEAVKKYPNAFIHFSNVKKLGVNPQKTHRDPPGIYFYPCKWLLGEDPSLSQFATQNAYYYVVSIKSSPSIVNLKTVSKAQGEGIAERNGWIADYRRVLSDDDAIEKFKDTPSSRSKPGKIFYEVMDYLANHEGKSWLSMLKGIDGLYDPGTSTIAEGEPAQLVIFNQKLITILLFGENKDQHQMRLGDILRSMAEEIGGSFQYKNKIPMISGSYMDKPYKITLETGYIKQYFVVESYQEGFWMSDKYEAADDTGSIDWLRDGFQTFFKRVIEKAGRKGTVEFWTENKVSDVLKGLLRPGLRIRSSIKNGMLHVYYGDMGTMMSYYVAGDVGARDILSLDVRLSFKETEIQIKKRIKAGVDINQTIIKVKSEAAKKFKDALLTEYDVERVGKIIEFMAKNVAMLGQ